LTNTALCGIINIIKGEKIQKKKVIKMDIIAALIMGFLFGVAIGIIIKRNK
jgi:thiamine transporter ThiT